ncbi:hypothetical protein [Nocardia fluminea]|uniref:hypothetical protein n=1 Tax=Nocardia fluminea TaxID=134984 RepID=UPI003655C89C
MSHPFLVHDEHEDPRLDAAFDSFVAAGHAPWLAHRTGSGLWADHAPETDRPLLPSGAASIPRLEGTDLSDLLDTRPIDGGWYKPEFVLHADDATFEFAAHQTGEVAADGGPFNRARLTLSLWCDMPRGIREIYNAIVDDPEQAPGLRLEAVTLRIPVTGPDGAPEICTVAGTVVDHDGERCFVTAFELRGDVVEATYVHLTRRGGAILDLTSTYDAYQTVFAFMPDTGFPIHGPWFDGWQLETYGNGVDRALPEPRFPGGYRYFPMRARLHRTTPIGTTFSTDRYRSRFTITTEKLSRPIIDANDLSEFASVRSEFRELTSVDIDQYPCLRRLYFGQVTGTVIAVPALYGIEHARSGVSARCDSIVDTSPTSLTGCKFDFTFQLAPLTDPVDMARLAENLTHIPEADSHTLRLVLPAGLDHRHPVALDGFSTARTSFADGATPHTLQLSVEIDDDQAIPATATANIFLHQLDAAGPAPLFANVPVRIDDALPQPIHTVAVLNLRRTAGTDELTTELGPDGHATVTNHSPFEVVLHRVAVARPNGVATAPLAEQPLLSGQTRTLPIDATAATSIALARSLAVPDPLPKSRLLEFVQFHTTIVQTLQHPLNFNAAGLNFATGSVLTIDIQVSLTESPALPIPAVTLSPGHPIDFVHVAVPVTSAATGLHATVALTVITATGTHTLVLTHDFVDEPILLITNATLTP